MRGLLSGIVFLLFGTSIVFALSQFLYALISHPREIKLEDTLKMVGANITALLLGTLAIKLLLNAG